MACDSLRLINFSLALKIQAMTPEETALFTEERLLDDELDYISLGISKSVKEISKEILNKYNKTGQSVISKIKGSLIWCLCLIGKDVYYDEPPSDVIGFDEWKDFLSFQELTGDKGDENPFCVIPIEAAERLLKSYEINKTRASNETDNSSQKISELIDKCKKNKNYKIAYMFDY